MTSPNDNVTISEFTVSLSLDMFNASVCTTSPTLYWVLPPSLPGASNANCGNLTWTNTSSPFTTLTVGGLKTILTQLQLFSCVTENVFRFKQDIVMPLSLYVRERDGLRRKVFSSYLPTDCCSQAALVLQWVPTNLPLKINTTALNSSMEIPSVYLVSPIATSMPGDSLLVLSANGTYANGTKAQSLTWSIISVDPKRFESQFRMVPLPDVFNASLQASLQLSPGAFDYSCLGSNINLTVRVVNSGLIDGVVVPSNSDSITLRLLMPTEPWAANVTGVRLQSKSGILSRSGFETVYIDGTGLGTPSEWKSTNSSVSYYTTKINSTVPFSYIAKGCAYNDNQLLQCFTAAKNPSDNDGLPILWVVQRCLVPGVASPPFAALMYQIDRNPTLQSIENLATAGSTDSRSVFSTINLSGSFPTASTDNTTVMLSANLTSASMGAIECPYTTDGKSYFYYNSLHDFVNNNTKPLCWVDTDPITQSFRLFPPPGAGAYYLSVSWLTQPSTTLDVFAAGSNQTLLSSYKAASISSISKNMSFTASDLILNTAGGEVISVRGTSFGPTPLMDQTWVNRSTFVPPTKSTIGSRVIFQFNDDKKLVAHVISWSDTAVTVMTPPGAPGASVSVYIEADPPASPTPIPVTLKYGMPVVWSLSATKLPRTTPSATTTGTPTMTSTSSSSATVTATSFPTPSITLSQGLSFSSTGSGTAALTFTATTTATLSPSGSFSSTRSGNSTVSGTASSTGSISGTQTSSCSFTPTSADTFSATVSFGSSYSMTPSFTPTATMSPSSTASSSPTLTLTSSGTPAKASMCSESVTPLPRVPVFPPQSDGEYVIFLFGQNFGSQEGDFPASARVTFTPTKVGGVTWLGAATVVVPSNVTVGSQTILLSVLSLDHSTIAVHLPNYVGNVSVVVEVTTTVGGSQSSVNTLTFLTYDEPYVDKIFVSTAVNDTFGELTPWSTTTNPCGVCGTQTSFDPSQGAPLCISGVALENVPIQSIVIRGKNFGQTGLSVFLEPRLALPGRPTRISCVLGENKNAYTDSSIFCTPAVQPTPGLYQLVLKVTYVEGNVTTYRKSDFSAYDATPLLVWALCPQHQYLDPLTKLCIVGSCNTDSTLNPNTTCAGGLELPQATPGYQWYYPDTMATVLKTENIEKFVCKCLCVCGLW